MKVYVFEYEGHYRCSLRKPSEAKIDGEVKEVDIPQSAAYLLLAAQAGTDALQDSLENAFTRGSRDYLQWGYDPARARWEDDGG